MEYAILAGMVALLGKEVIVALGRKKNNPTNPNGTMMVILKGIKKTVDEVKDLLIRIDERDRVDK